MARGIRNLRLLLVLAVARGMRDADEHGELLGGLLDLEPELAASAGEGSAGELQAAGLLMPGAQANALPHESGLPWRNLPAELTRCWRDETELGLGAFGAVWRARCQEPLPDGCPACPDEEKFFALKVAHSKGSLLTWQSRDVESLGFASEECRTIQAIEARFGGRDAGRRHVVSCVADHIDKANYMNAKVLYLVLEAGGEPIDQFWDEELRLSSSAALQQLVVEIASQLLQALAFLGRGGTQSGYIHHDVKSDNILVRRSEEQDGPAILVQFADFGATVKASVDPKGKSTACNIGCPPEWNVRDTDMGVTALQAFAAARPLAFDVFPAAGVMMRILTGRDIVEHVYYTRHALFAGFGVAKDIFEMQSFCNRRLFLRNCPQKHVWFVYWTFLRMVRPTAAELLVIPLFRPFFRSLSVYTKVFAPLLRHKGFSTLLDAMADMLTTEAEHRPLAQDLLDRPALAGILSGGNMTADLPAGLTYEPVGFGTCAFTSGQQGPCVRRAVPLGNRAYLEARLECETLCDADGGCKFFALSNRHHDPNVLDCRLYTFNALQGSSSGFRPCPTSTSTARARLASEDLQSAFKKDYICFRRMNFKGVPEVHSRVELKGDCQHGPGHEGDCQHDPSHENNAAAGRGCVALPLLACHVALMLLRGWTAA